MTINDAGVGTGTGWAARFTGAGGLVLFLCWQHVQAIRLGYRVEEARREAAERAGRVTALKLELEERLSPAQVATRAARLGMVPAAPDSLRRLPGRGDAPAIGTPLHGFWGWRPTKLAASRG